MKKSKGVEIIFDEKGIDVGYYIKIRPLENGKLLCYIPGFDFIYSAKNDADANIKADAMMKCFFELHDAASRNIKSLLSEIHRLGFRSEKHAYVMGQLLHNRHVNAKMKVSQDNIPTEFQNAEILERNYKIAS